MGTLLALLTAGLLLWIWNENLRTRERVLRACAVACRELDVQLLDQNVALSRFGIAAQRGRVRIERLYCFEFSTDGVDRREGTVLLWGGRIQHVQMDHPEGRTILGGNSRTAAPL